MHALPLAYSKDLQEDKEPLFDAIDNLELCLAAATGMLAGDQFNRERLAAAAEDEMLAATDLADALVPRGVPFREAHGLVGGLVRDAVERGKPLSELTDSELNGVPEKRDVGHAVLAAGRSSRSGSRAAPSRGAREAARPPAPLARWRTTRAGATRRSARCALNREFFDRSVHEVARDLIGCELAVGEAAAA